MMKHEFEEKAGISVTDSEYEKIETVYMYYPGINSQEEFLNLYKSFEFTVIIDMLPRAQQIKAKEQQIRDLKQAIKDMQQTINEAEAELIKLVLPVNPQALAMRARND